MSKDAANKPSESYLEYLARCASEGNGPAPMAAPPPVKLIHMGDRFAATWLPRGFGAWRAYCGSGWRFLQLWRLRVAVRWAYE